MFVLSTLEDQVRLEPKDLGSPTEAAVSAVLERAFLDRVIRDLGLVITLYDILSIGPGFVLPSDGGAHHEVKFRVVVFRPFPGETLRGTVLEQHRTKGIRVSLGFFEDIWVPPHGMMEGTFWKEEEGCWRWHVDGGDNGDGEEDEDEGSFPFEDGGEIALAVTGSRYPKSSGVAALAAAASTAGAGAVAGAGAGAAGPGAGPRGVGGVEGPAPHPFAPMEVVAKVSGEGMGMCSWYESGEEAEEGAEGEEELEGEKGDDE